MALVSGQTLSSFAELNTTPYTEFSTVCAAEDSDDEYVYVSSLAEQIAHALMLDDDDDNDPPAQPQEMWYRKDNVGSASASWRVPKKEELQAVKNAEAMCPVSHFAAAWRDHGPTEWDCFYTPSPHHVSKQLSTLYSNQLERSFSKHRHLFRGWNSACLANNKQLAVCSHETWDSRSQETQSTSYVTPVRKESIGTGVFLPKIVNSGSQYRRKAGLSLSKSAYAPRHKCQP